MTAEEKKAIARNAVRFEYETLTGEPTINSQGEPDIDYVEYLENLVADRGNYARLQIEKDRERVKAEFKENPFEPIEKIMSRTPIELD